MRTNEQSEVMKIPSISDCLKNNILPRDLHALSMKNEGIVKALVAEAHRN
jgi:hypothetical protein